MSCKNILMNILRRIEKKGKIEKEEKIEHIIQQPTIPYSTCLQYLRTIDFSHSIQHKRITYNSSTPAIIANPNNPEQYIVSVRFVNYTVTANGMLVFKRKSSSIHSKFLVDASFTQITPAVYIDKISGCPLGIEDIRLFYYNSSIYYSACFYTSNTYNQMICGKYDDPIEKHTIRTLHTARHEKNWSYVEYKGELCMVYTWYPLQIGKIDFTTDLLHIIEEKQLPDVFTNVRGSTPSYRWKDEIWFIVHTTSIIGPCRKYHHRFVVFDTDMNLLRYSEPFKFENRSVEFCLGLIIEQERTIVSYSTLDCTTRIGLIRNEYIAQGLIWHRNV